MEAAVAAGIAVLYATGIFRVMRRKNFKPKKTEASKKKVPEKS